MAVTFCRPISLPELSLLGELLACFEIKLENILQLVNYVESTVLLLILTLNNTDLSLTSHC